MAHTLSPLFDLLHVNVLVYVSFIFCKYDNLIYCLSSVRYTPYFFDKNMLDNILEESVDQHFHSLIQIRHMQRRRDAIDDNLTAEIVEDTADSLWEPPEVHTCFSTCFPPLRFETYFFSFHFSFCNGNWGDVLLIELILPFDRFKKCLMRLVIQEFL